MSKETLMRQIESVDRIANSSKFKRLLNNPFKYVPAMFFKKVIYPKNQKEKIVTCSLFYGKKIKIGLPASTDIYLTGGKSHSSEIRLAKFLILNLQKNNSFLDIGAHYGYFTLLASELLGEEGKVLSFEPAQNTFALLKENIEETKNVQVFNQAVSSMEKTITFYEFPNLYSEYNSSDVSQFENEAWFKKSRIQKVEIEAVSIDYISKRFNFKPDMIKIDVEGAEEDVITGGLSYLKMYSPKVIMEYLESDRKNTAHQNALKLMQGLGYKSYVISDDGSLKPISDIEDYLFSAGLESDNIVFLKD